MTFLFLPVFATVSLTILDKGAIATEANFEQVVSNQASQPQQKFNSSISTPAFDLNFTSKCGDRYARSQSHHADCHFESLDLSDWSTSLVFDPNGMVNTEGVTAKEAENIFASNQTIISQVYKANNSESQIADDALENCQQNQCSYGASGLTNANNLVEEDTTSAVEDQSDSVHCQAEQSNLNCNSTLIELDTNSAAKVKIIAQTRETTEELEFIIPGDTPDDGTPVETINVVEVMADQQQYDDRQQIITAQGNVVLRYGGAVLTADRLQVNLPGRLAVAQGEVVLRRGSQTFRGDRFEYYFAQDRGTIVNASGEIYFPSASQDFAPEPANQIAETIPTEPLFDRLQENQPLQRITTAEGYQFAIGDVENLAQAEGLPTFEAGGQINRIRFVADRIDFDADGWQAYEVRITNDPFSPPELEVRADTATFRNVEPLVDELVTTNSRVVFDDNLALPIFQDRLTFDRRPTDPGLFSIAIDGRDRGGVYLERGFTLYSSETTSWKVSPQYLIQRSVGLGSEDEDDDSDDDNSGGFSPDAFGLESEFISRLNLRTDLEAEISFSSLDVTDLADDFRARIQLERRLGNIEQPHDLRLEYTYRDRVFNGSLGFQTVDSSIGGVLVSPSYQIGTTGIEYAYQGSVQYIIADTDRDELIENSDDDEPVGLMRYQAAIAFNRDFDLWRGTPLPPTEEEGLRYTSTPVQPYFQLVTGLSAVATYYDSGDTQNSLRGKIGIRGQLGRFSRPWFDYTGFRVTYEQGIIDGESPFRFDRFEDTSVLSFGITQQLYGPFLLGFSAAISLDENEDISTDYFLEYSRRTYSVRLRYNSELELGSIDFRINDFNWVGDPEPFEGIGEN